MPFARMSAALSQATAQQSVPKQFSLSEPDFVAFIGGTHPLKDEQGQKPDWFFDTIPVVEGNLATSSSYLHVLVTQNGATRPIPV